MRSFMGRGSGFEVQIVMQIGHDLLAMPEKNLAEIKKDSTFVLGEMVEWSITVVLKTIELRGSGGSNPSLSAET